MSDTPITHHLTRRRVRTYQDGGFASWNDDHPCHSGSMPGYYDITITPHKPEKAPGQVWMLQDAEVLILGRDVRLPHVWRCLLLLSGQETNLSMSDPNWVYLRDEPLPPAHDPQPGDLFDFMKEDMAEYRVVITGLDTRNPGWVFAVNLAYPGSVPGLFNLNTRPNDWKKVER